MVSRFQVLEEMNKLMKEMTYKSIKALSLTYTTKTGSSSISLSFLFCSNFHLGHIILISMHLPFWSICHHLSPHLFIDFHYSKLSLFQNILTSLIFYITLLPSTQCNFYLQFKSPLQICIPTAQFHHLSVLIMIFTKF